MRNNKNQRLIAVLLAAATVLGVAALLFGGVGSGESDAYSGTIIINEIMAANTSSVPDDLGKYSDWVELYNTGASPINIEGWALSDNQQRPARWAFPSVTIQPGEYLVVYCSGEDKRNPSEGALHTNFKLSSKGETVILTDNLGGIVDAKEFGNMDSNISYGRNPIDANEWITFDKATPGFPNTDEGHLAYIESIRAEGGNIILSEIMTSNRTTIMDDYGEYSDYIEIQNVGTEPENLLAYGLSDKENNIMKWQFPDITIQPGEYLVVFCSGRGKPSEEGNGYLHANFRLSSYQETVLLSSNRGQMLDTVVVRELAADTVYARDPNSSDSNNWKVMTKPTPGFPNTDEGFNQFNDTAALPKGPIVINEVMLYNDQYAKADDNQFYDWIELKNISASAVNLKDWGLTNNTKNPAKFRLPDFTLAPGESKIIYASGLNKKASTASIHTNFRLSSAGDVVGLFDATGNYVDRINAADVPLNMSYGRMDGKAGFYYFQSPTPGNTNANGARGFSTKPVIELASGSYRGAQTVTLSCPDPEAEIYYTLDGSVPTRNSSKYTGPITIQPKGTTKTVSEKEYAIPAGTSLRARTFKGDALGSSVATASYLIDVPHTLPIISISMEPADFSSHDRGIYALGDGVKTGDTYKGANFQFDWERQAYFEYIDETGTVQMGMDGGIKIFGAYSRFKEQKGFSLWARSRYGKESIDYPFFTTRPELTSFKSIVLRAGANDCNRTKIRDVVITDLAREYTDLDVAAYRTCVVYINGEYWGLYHIREKINKYYLAQHYNLENPENIHLIVGNRNAMVGDNKDFLDLRNFIDNNDMSVQANYEKVKERMDIASFIDWTIFEIWTNNSDLGNIKFWRVKEDGTENSKWRWILYDFCWGFDNPVTYDRMVESHLNPQGMSPTKGISTVYLRKLLNNAEFKKQFLERYGYLIQNVFVPDKVIAKIDEIAAPMAEEIQRDFPRWGIPPNSWRDRNTSQINAVKEWVRKRPGYCIYHARRYFNLSEQECIAIFGSVGTAP
ncbi:lamin tail domain-containing protein [Eubacteriales bacterium OttesenSCG-928-N14]|nr:lamin tail domain-containing protein [Eubacteriales bacterium OttesenSCG-928-N14]